MRRSVIIPAGTFHPCRVVRSLLKYLATLTTLELDSLEAYFRRKP